MIDLSPLTATIILILGLIIPTMLGFPVFYACGGIALLVGLLSYGPGIPQIFYGQLIGIVSNYIFLAVPLFVFMGAMTSRAGVADRLFKALYLWLGKLRGGLAIITIIIGTILAACVGIVTASVMMLGMIVLPEMLKRGYNKSLATGAVCGASTLGILIPPSVMLVVYGPNAQLSVGKLFAAAFMPGFLLAGLYMIYITIRAYLVPDCAPSMPPDEARVPLRRKITLLLTSVVPPAFLVLSVLGVIYFGVASPTEAAAVGAFASIILPAAYRTLTWKSLKMAVFETIKVTGVVGTMAIGAMVFVSVFLGLGGGKVVTDIILAFPFGRWGVFAMIMFITFIMGFFMDWLGIVFILVPILSPILPKLGFDPLWMAMMIIVNFQTSFMTPPFCPTIFVLRPILKPEWGVTDGDLIRGVWPYVVLILITLALCIAFPQIILWLPSTMVK